MCDSIGSLKKHLNATHKRMAPVRFQCEYCGKEFDSKAGRDLHAANHTGNSLPAVMFFFVLFFLVKLLHSGVY